MTGSNAQARRALSRREFLAGAAAIGTGVAATPLSWAALLVVDHTA